MDDIRWLGICSSILVGDGILAVGDIFATVCYGLVFIVDLSDARFRYFIEIFQPWRRGTLGSICLHYEEIGSYPLLQIALH